MSRTVRTVHSYTTTLCAKDSDSLGELVDCLLAIGIEPDHDMVDSGLGVPADQLCDLLCRARAWRVDAVLMRECSLGALDVDENAARSADTRGIPVVLLTGHIERRQARKHLIDRAGPGRIPDIGVFGGELQHAGAVGTDHDRHLAISWTTRPHFRAIGRVIQPVKIGLTGANEVVENLESFLEARCSMIVGIAVGREFRLVPAGAEPKNEPSHR